MKNNIMKFFLLFGLFFASVNAYAIFDVIGGHFDDAVSRFSSDKFIVKDPKSQALSSGMIDENAKGQDFLHHAEGDVYLVMHNNELYVQFDENFSSTPGPDYHVYVSNDAAKITDESDFQSSNQIELGRLTKGSGASYYKIDGYSVADIKSVTVYCKAYNEFIGSAEIKN